MTGTDALEILVFAAGASARMRGVDKLMQLVDGQPLLARAVSAALDTGHPVTVLLPPDRPERAKALAHLPVRLVEVPDAALGMSASIRAGIAALPETALGAMFLMADMPDLCAADLTKLIQAYEDADGLRVVRATSADGTPGSPSIIPRRFFGRMATLRGDKGGRSLMRDEDVAHVALPGQRALIDLDTPDDWDAWCAARKGAK